MEILGDPVGRATMGFQGVVGALPFYVGLLERCAEHFRDAKPDVAVLVDSPALHVPLGRIARRYGVPVLHFVTPQHWAWAPWRAAGYARAVDRALTILPFERAWFARRGVPVAHVGHPLLDELAGMPCGRLLGGDGTIAVLPGSRSGVIDLNLPWMLQALAALRAGNPPIDVAVIQAGDRHLARIERHLTDAGARGWARVEAGDLHGSLSRARAAFAVSGTALIDVLHHRLPTVCIYRVATRRGMLLYRHALLTPFFASVNLLAGREVMPEFCFRGRGPFDAVVRALDRALRDDDYRREAVSGLNLAAARLGPPGASRRAALHALDLARQGREHREGDRR
jgi:lipid-A-disaccharide synthase